MRKSTPLLWIEKSEATEVLSGALFERSPRRSFARTSGAALSDWLNRAHCWLAPQLPMAWPVLRTQAAPVRHTDGLRVRRGCDEDYRRPR